jgi:hypothetical protein
LNSSHKSGVQRHALCGGDVQTWPRAHIRKLPKDHKVANHSPLACMRIASPLGKRHAG